MSHVYYSHIEISPPTVILESFHRSKASCPISSTYGVKRVWRVHSYWAIETQGKTNNTLIAMARILFINNTAYASIWPVHFLQLSELHSDAMTRIYIYIYIYIIDANFMNLCFYIAYKIKMQLHIYKVGSKWEKHSFVHHIHALAAFGLQL